MNYPCLSSSSYPQSAPTLANNPGGEGKNRFDIYPYRRHTVSIMSNQRHILATYALATADERAAGMGWYHEAHQAADALHLSPDIGPAVVAALSPGLRWERNIEAAQRVIAREDLNGLGVRWYDGVRKAERIIAGADPRHVLKGNKVRAFYQCIRNPLNRVHVCVDGHAFGIWRGKRITLDAVPELTDTVYRRISGDYVQAAQSIGILPMQLQAITWCAWRRLVGVANGGTGRNSAI